jgi:hypothetical protein
MEELLQQQLAITSLGNIMAANPDHPDMETAELALLDMCLHFTNLENLYL